MAGFITADTATVLPPEAAGAVVVCGSHGGLYPGYLLAKARVRGVVLCDAGIGLDEAGAGSLPYFQRLNIAAAVVSHLSCRIGDTADMLARGRISRRNDAAAALGVEEGDTAPDAAQKLTGAAGMNGEPPEIGEGRFEARTPGGGVISLLNSAGMVTEAHRGQIVVTGSHGGLIGGDPARALKAQAFAAVFSDAGGGADGAGFARLPALDERGIAALTVSAQTARIGDARSVYESGVISAANRTAAALGAKPGAPAKAILNAWAERLTA